MLNAIPDEGMSREEFYRLLRPFVAGVGDAHTNFTRGYGVDPRRPGGVPLRLKVVEESLVVDGHRAAAHRTCSAHASCPSKGCRSPSSWPGSAACRASTTSTTRCTCSRPGRSCTGPTCRTCFPEWTGLGRVRVELQRPDGRLAAAGAEAAGRGPVVGRASVACGPAGARRRRDSARRSSGRRTAVRRSPTSASRTWAATARPASSATRSSRRSSGRPRPPSRSASWSSR